MYQDLAKGIGTRNYSSPNDLAQAIAAILGSSLPLMQRNRVTIEMTLPDSDSAGLVRICAVKNNPPADSPAISLHLCGALRIGSTVLTEAQLAEIINTTIGDDANVPPDLPNYDPNGTQALANVNGVLTWMDIDTSTCGGVGGGAGLMAGGPDGGMAGLDGGGAEEGEAGGEV